MNGVTSGDRMSVCLCVASHLHVFVKACTIYKNKQCSTVNTYTYRADRQTDRQTDRVDRQTER